MDGSLVATNGPVLSSIDITDRVADVETTEYWRWMRFILSDSDEYSIKKTRSKSFRRFYRHCTAPASFAQRRRALGSTQVTATSEVSYPGHGAITRRINELMRLLHVNARFTRSAPEFTGQESLTIALAEPFLTQRLRDRAALVHNWKPILTHLQL